MVLAESGHDIRVICCETTRTLIAAMDVITKYTTRVSNIYLYIYD